MIAEERLQATEKTRVQAAAQTTTRLSFIDNLRTGLVILVVLHHVALVYGASTPFYYVEPPFSEPLAFLVLLIFALLNQAWFMGAFFLLAGYFSPGSYARKGPASFLSARMLRLGIPLLVFFFVLNPISELGVFLMPHELTGITQPLTWQTFLIIYPELLGMGPLWFVAMLLVFSFGYAGWRGLTGGRAAVSQPVSAPPGYAGIAIFILVLALVSYLVRMLIPLGQAVLGFPTLAYLPQYLSFFILGALAVRRDWFRTIPASMGIVGALTSAAVLVFLFPLAFSGQMFSLELSPALNNAMGNGHWQSAVYALWDSAFAVGICLALIPLFRRFFNAAGGFGSFLARHSYAVYFVHIPLVVYLAYAIRGVELGALLKFVLASAIVVPACFLAAALLRKVPGVSKVL